MARGDYFIGRQTAGGYALQASASGTRWDGTVGDIRWFKPMSGGLNFSIGADQNYDDTMDVDPTSITTGATKYSGSDKYLLSYEHQELLMIAIAGAADAVAGSGPYTHTLALADKEVYLTIYRYYEDYKGTKTQRLYANAMLTQLTITANPEERPTIEISWVAQTMTSSTPGAAPTINTADLVDWNELSVTIGGTAICANSFTFTVSRPADDSDVALCSDSPGVNTIFGSGQRTAQFTVEAGIDDSIETILEATTTSVAGNATFDNGEATTDNRQIQIPITSMYATTLDTNPATWGKRRESVNFNVLSWSGFVVINSLSAAQE